jgi:hypothetical protein
MLRFLFECYPFERDPLTRAIAGGAAAPVASGTAGVVRQPLGKCGEPMP